MSTPTAPNPAIAKLLKLLADQPTALHSSTAPASSPHTAPSSHLPPPSTIPSVSTDPSTSTITLTTGPRITGHGNRYALPPSYQAAHLADATRLTAILLAAIQRLNCGVAERNAQLAARSPGPKTGEQGPTPFLRVNVVVNSGVTIVGDGNVVGVEGRKRKRGGEEEGRRVRVCGES
ncbi:hypothetical protein CAC42_7841 [Sphaceloma murrayae]|uniref:Uncharacterized protein n=1 Tax=Sphaceloma murrayae TaxID=2082308 RepID=A0A2K1QXU6_9PEZI|nr:hypothetical protein CAC42_7841 [Sphaceloma murrayae]